MRDLGRRMRRRGALPQQLTGDEVNRIVRRFGFVLEKCRNTMMSNLGDSRLAEDVNDTLKPLCDWLLKFDCRSPQGYGDDLKPEDFDEK